MKKKGKTMKLIHVWPDGFKSVMNFVSHEACRKFVEYHLTSKSVCMNEKGVKDLLKEWDEKFAIHHDGHMIILLDGKEPGL